MNKKMRYASNKFNSHSCEPGPEVHDNNGWVWLIMVIKIYSLTICGPLQPRAIPAPGQRCCIKVLGSLCIIWWLHRPAKPNAWKTWGKCLVLTRWILNIPQANNTSSGRSWRSLSLTLLHIQFAGTMYTRYHQYQKAGGKFAIAILMLVLLTNAWFSLEGC